MNFDPVAQLLRERIGLAPESLGKSTLPAAVERRTRALGLRAGEDYFACLQERPAEFQALLEEVVVPETWFFRGGRLFPWLAEHARGLIAQGRKFRALSVPCSTGEEPLSLAIALLEEGVQEGWSIEGVDLSARALARARRGRYTELSFRQTDPALRERYFRHVGSEYEVKEPPRQHVRYRVGNLVDPLFLAGEGPFDLIFCRNLFIYLHPDARQKALANLDRLLAPDGLLCLGHAEPLHDPRFQRTGPHGFFLYRRAAEEQKAEAPPPKSTARHAKEKKRTTRLRLPASARHEPPPPAAPPAPHAQPEPFGQARRLADQGRLTEALALCREQVERGAPSADGYALLGVLYQARHEDAEAVRCFERALYLEPGHREALLHLMLLRQQRGETHKADLLRRRLERADS